jgi:dihydroorotate dehydrogenase
MLYRAAKSIFFRMDPERAHHFALNNLTRVSKSPIGLSLLRAMYGIYLSPELQVNLCGLSFSHPIGLSAGLDKNGTAPAAFAAMGFGFVEVGTITPKPQPGNVRPRLFRLPEDYALINRMGFNNVGCEAMALSLRDTKLSVPLFINIGKNKDTPNELAYEDYVASLRMLYHSGDAFVVNVSSPNTPGLRNLQQSDEMKQLLLETLKAREECNFHYSGQPLKPIFVKISPDLTDEQLSDTIRAIQDTGVDGIVATNTTLSRDGLKHPSQQESGGLSGKPLRQRSTQIIRDVYTHTKGQVPIIGSGGIFTPEDAYEKIRAGASLVQIYTSLIYEGPGIVAKLAEGLSTRLRSDGFGSIRDAVGSY